MPWKGNQKLEAMEKILGHLDMEITTCQGKVWRGASPWTVHGKR